MEAVVNALYAHLKQGRIQGRRCAGCGTVQFPPRGLCPQCGGDDLAWVTMSGRGKLKFASAGQHRLVGVQFIQGVIQLEEGPWVSGMVLDDSFDLTKPERIWDYNGANLDVAMEIVKNPAGLEVVAYRVVR